MWLKTLLTIATAAERWHFEQSQRHPQKAQANLLRQLMRSHAQTVIGQRHGFHRIKSTKDYAREVPVGTYEAMRADVESILAGQKSVLTRGSPLLFSTTSGTTDKPKYIPVTATGIAGATALNRLWFAYAVQAEPHCLDYGILCFVSPMTEGYLSSGYPHGATSGLLLQRTPWAVRRKFIIPYAVSLIADAKTRYFLAARFALAHRISMVATPNPSTLVRLAEVMESDTDALLAAVHEGDIGIHVGDVLPVTTRAEVLAALQRAASPAPMRARQLSRLTNKNGTLTPQLAWPEMRLIGCWQGGSVGVQSARLSRFYGSVPRRDLGYLATEGLMTLPTENDTPSAYLTLHRNYFEFIDEAALGQPHPPYLLAHQLRAGQQYALVVTTSSGLWRYSMHDIVQVHDLENGTPRVSFLRKSQDFSSMMGEKLHVNHVLQAVAAACDRTHAHVQQCRLIPNLETLYYELLVEFNSLPDGNLADFCAFFDGRLLEINQEYANKRLSGRLHAPKLWNMPKGWSQQVIDHDLTQGKREEQYKWQVLTAKWDAVSLSLRQPA